MVVLSCLIVDCGSGITNETNPNQLLECTAEQLGNVGLCAHLNFTSKTLEDAMAVLKFIVVISVPLGILKSDLAAMRQDPNEPFCTFAARVQGKAETWEFKITFFGHC